MHIDPKDRQNSITSVTVKVTLQYVVIQQHDE